MERLQEELTCAICCEISEPRVLPCWQRLLPALPAAGPQALPVNFALQAVLEKCRQEEAAEAGTCREHPRQPLNIGCPQERRLVCGHCLTIGKHPIGDLRSAGRKGREASGQLLEELGDRARSERLRQHKARCQEARQRDREAVLQNFKELGDALEHQQEALLGALDELGSRISEKYDLKVEESELKDSLHSAVQKEESPLLFPKKLDRLQLRLQALRQKQLPEPEPVEIHPRMEKVLQDTGAGTEMGQVHKIHTPKLQLAPQSRCSAKQTAAAPWAALTEPSLLLLILLSLVSLSLEDLLSGTLPAPLVHLWKFLQRVYQDCCIYLQDRAQELCHSSALPLGLCRILTTLIRLKTPSAQASIIFNFSLKALHSFCFCILPFLYCTDLL